MIVDFIGMPLCAGASTYGTEEAPSYIRKCNLSSLFNRNFIHDLGNIDCCNEKDYSFFKMKNLLSVLTSCKNVHEQMVQSIKSGHFPLVFGGDHSLSWGTISAAADCFDNLGVIYIDAHGDFNTAETSLTHNVHGMHMAYLMGFGHLQENEIKDIPYTENCLAPQNVFFVGSRALDQGELNFATANSLNIHSSQDIISQGASKVAYDIICAIRNNGIKHVHISFDVDVIDPAFFPGTGVPEKAGISVSEAKTLLSVFLSELPVCSMDFVEYNPIADRDNISQSCCLDLLRMIDSFLLQ